VFPSPRLCAKAMSIQQLRPHARLHPQSSAALACTDGLQGEGQMRRQWNYLGAALALFGGCRVPRLTNVSTCKTSRFTIVSQCSAN
jgi:hypothetical protein